MYYYFYIYFFSLQKKQRESVISYPYSLREAISITKHLQAHPSDGLPSALSNCFDWERDPDVRHLLKEVFSANGIEIFTEGGEREGGVGGRERGLEVGVVKGERFEGWVSSGVEFFVEREGGGERGGERGDGGILVDAEVGVLERFTPPSYLMKEYLGLFYFILFYFILFYFILFYFILFYFILFYFILFYFILFYFMLCYFILCYFFFNFLFFFFLSFFFFVSLYLLKSKYKTIKTK